MEEILLPPGRHALSHVSRSPAARKILRQLEQRMEKKGRSKAYPIEGELPLQQAPLPNVKLVHSPKFPRERKKKEVSQNSK